MHTHVCVCVYLSVIQGWLGPLGVDHLTQGDEKSASSGSRKLTLNDGCGFPSLVIWNRHTETRDPISVENGVTDALKHVFSMYT